MSDLKRQLYQYCIDYVQNRIDASEYAIKATQQATNDETKSSAGDKYETSREMMQQDTNRNLAQLNEANKLMVALKYISPNTTFNTAETGSLVITNNGKFYVAVSAGMFSIDNEAYIAVSPASPIGLQLKGKKAGDQFSLNGKSYQIESII